MLEAMLLYFRDNVARPCIGHHDADRFVPFLWTIFFFVLACNLFGMIPWMGSPTGSLAVTARIGIHHVLVVVGSGMKKLGRRRLLEGSSAAHGSAAGAQDFPGADDLRDRSVRPAGEAWRAWPCVCWRT